VKTFSHLWLSLQTSKISLRPHYCSRVVDCTRVLSWMLDNDQFSNHCPGSRRNGTLLPKPLKLYASNLKHKCNNISGQVYVTDKGDTAVIILMLLSPCVIQYISVTYNLKHFFNVSRSTRFDASHASSSGALHTLGLPHIIRNSCEKLKTDKVFSEFLMMCGKPGVCKSSWRWCMRDIETRRARHQ
jgi:hypothetical protein